MFIDEKRFGESQQPSLAGFTAFVATKDPTEEYTFTDRTVCACAQYARSVGKYDQWIASPTIEDFNVWVALNDFARLSTSLPRTFGKLAQRLDQVGG